MTGSVVQAVEKGATITTYAASSSAVFLGLTHEEWGIAASIVGIVGVIATFAFNAWWKIRYGERRKTARPIN